MSSEELRLAELRSRIQALRPQRVQEAATPGSEETQAFAKVLEERVSPATTAPSSPGQDLDRTVQELQSAQNTYQQMQHLQEQLLLAYHQALPTDPPQEGQKTVTPSGDPKP